MQTNYQSPKAVEIGKAETIILGEKGGSCWDQPTLSFVRSCPSAIDVDE